MTKTQAKEQVLRFARSHGIAVNGKGGIPLLAKGEWLYCADDWLDAYSFLSKANLAHIDHGQTPPWRSV